MSSFARRPAPCFFCVAVLPLAAQFLIAQAPIKSRLPPSAKPATVNAYVPMPKDIGCDFKSIQTEGVVGNGEMHQLNGTVDGFFCWMADKGPESAKEVPLASRQIADGVLTTKNFGKFKIAEVGSADNRVDSFEDQVSILRDTLPALRAFLRTPAPAAGSAVRNPAGAWEGLLKTNLGEGRFSFKLHRNGDKWAGEMRDYSNKERESYLPLKDLKVEGNAITFAVQPILDGPHYVGKLSDDGESISGNLVSGDLRIPLNLKRKGE